MYVDSNPSKQFQEKAAARLADLTYSQHDYRAAYHWYLTAWVAQGNKPTLAIVTGVAQSAALVGDNATAISFYRQAITLVPETPKDKHDEQVGSYATSISMLGGKP